MSYRIPAGSVFLKIGDSTLPLSSWATPTGATGVIFAGVAARNNELMQVTGTGASSTVNLQQAGIALARVKGKVEIGQPVGCKAGENNLVRGGHPVVGTARQAIATDGEVKLIQVQIAGAGAGGVGHIRGEWYSGAGPITKQDDIWIVTSGANPGTYAALVDNPANDPWVGGGDWIKFPSSNSLGQWM